ncbi:MAG: 4-hydroxy-3-methylbut-2-enyl diphosphate reductase [Planctomycetota bacterium]
MRVIVAQHCGFCFGVKRALEMAKETTSTGERIWTDGPIIHNSQEVARLEQNGIRHLKSDDELSKGDVVLLRAHGVTRIRKAELIGKGVKVVDATCPRVAKAQKIIHDYTSKGYTGIIIGDHNHAEIRSILGHAEGPCVVVANGNEANKVSEDMAPFVVISQTTFNIYEIENLLSLLPLNAERDHIVETICDATQKRQKAAREIASLADVVFVVGGYHSANTARLAEVCRAENPRTYHIETASEITREHVEGAKIAGVTAGASTPDWVIEEVREKLESL